MYPLLIKTFFVMAGTYSQMHIQLVFSTKNHHSSFIKKEHKNEIEKSNLHHPNLFTRNLTKTNVLCGKRDMEYLPTAGHKSI